MEATTDQSKVIPLVSEQQFEVALTEMQKQLKEQNPATINLLNELHKEIKSIVWTLLQNFPPEGHVKNCIDALFLSAGFVNLSLDYYGSAELRIKFEDTGTKELDAEINNATPKELYGGQIKKLKEIRMMILSVGLKMDKVGGAMTEFDAARMLGQARNDIHRAVIFIEEATKNIGYILTENKPSIITAGSVK